MFSLLRNRFGIPGVISVIALVFAMLGGAYAASNDGGGKATASAKAKKGPRGPKGATGPAGPAGSAGPQGPAGAKGDTGAAGSNGKDGTNGTNGAPGAPGNDGKSVVFVGSFGGADEEPPNEGPCEGAGGSEYETEESGSTNLICNGEQGKEGSPWTAGGTLPPGETETGTWAFNASSDDGEYILAPISFPIPLAAPLGEAHVHFQGEEGFAAACPASEFAGTLNPKANPGELCVYFNPFGEGLVNATFAQINSPSSLETRGASVTGAILRFAYSAAEPSETARGFGSWAVTGAAG